MGYELSSGCSIETIIGSLPNDWALLTVDEIKAKGKSIISGPFGSNIGSRFFVEQGVPVIRGNNLTLDSRRLIDAGYVFLTDQKAAELGTWAERDDLIFTAAGTLGQVGIIHADSHYERYIISNKQLRLRINTDSVDPYFAYYWFSSPFMQKYIAQRNTGSSVPLINLSVLKSLPLPVPPLSEQKAIVKAISALDDKIELNRQMNRTLEEMAQAIFKHWFVDFGPFRDGGMQDSELGPIPVGWRVGTLGEIAGFLNGYAFKSQDWTDKGVPVVKIGSVKPGYVDLNQVSYVSDDVAMQAQRYRLFAGDILVGMTGYVGEVGLVPICDCNPLLNQRVGKIEMRSDGLSERAFLFCLLRQPSFKFFVESRAHGTAQANASSKDITNFPTVIPPVETGCYFNKLVETFIQRILINRAEMTTLETIRDTLLPKLMSGELRVPVSDNAG